MGVMAALFDALFGGGRNLVKETAEVFTQNAEAAAARAARYQGAALDQYAAEFMQPRRGRFDRFMDGLNRLPRPALALGTLGLFVAAMIDPIWFASRMQGIALVPEPLWWLLGAIVSFYFGARHQWKAQQFQRSMAQTVARAAVVSKDIAALQALRAGAGQEAQQGAGPAAEAAAPTDPALLGAGENAALAEWRGVHGN